MDDSSAGVLLLTAASISAAAPATMGNQLMSVAPSQILPVEHYLTDLQELTYDVR